MPFRSPAGYSRGCFWRWRCDDVAKACFVLTPNTEIIFVIVGRVRGFGA